MPEEIQSAQPMPVPVDESHILATYANFCRVTGTPEELTALIRAEYDKWGRVIRETGATVQ